MAANFAVSSGQTSGQVVKTKVAKHNFSPGSCEAERLAVLINEAKLRHRGLSCLAADCQASSAEWANEETPERRTGSIKS